MTIFIIAEIGINHNGDIGTAHKLIDMAVDCGADAVKFQKRSIDLVYTKRFLASPRESPWGTTQGDQKKGLEFNGTQYQDIDHHCKKRKIKWFASAWDMESLKFLRKLKLPFNKIASPMLTNIPFIEAVAGERKHTFISTAMSTMADISKAVAIFRATANCPFTLMHSVGIYPCPDEWTSIGMVHVLRGRFACPVGYSAHQAGINASLAAMVLGATAIEHHITLDRSMYGSDQSASLERDGLQRIVQFSKDRDFILGDGVKRILPEEEENAKKLRYWEVGK